MTSPVMKLKQKKNYEHLFKSCFKILGCFTYRKLSSFEDIMPGKYIFY